MCYGQTAHALFNHRLPDATAINTGLDHSQHGRSITGSELFTMENTANIYCTHLAAVRLNGTRMEKPGKCQDQMVELEISHCEILEGVVLIAMICNIRPISDNPHETELRQ